MVRRGRPLDGLRGEISAINHQAEDPAKQGKAQPGELAGLCSLRAVGQRYRILYKINILEIVVLFIAAGLRRQGDKEDICNLAKKFWFIRKKVENQRM